jgi:flagellar biosynthesis protein FlhA
MIIGLVQQELTLAEAGHAYALLTVGDGLVSQIPAIIVSTAAGLLVSKSTSTGSAEKALFGQLGGYPRALGLSAFLMLLLAVLPGIPALPFLTLSGVSGGLAWASNRRDELAAAARSAAEENDAPASAGEEPITDTLQLDSLRLELGYGLLVMINGQGGERLTDQIKALRRQLAQEMGFVLPSVRIQDNLQLPANSYAVRVKEIEAGIGELRPNMLLVLDPKGERIPLPGEATTEPTFGLPATWIEASGREEALARGYTVVDPATVVTTHLTEVVKDHMPELMSYAETQKLLDGLGEAQGRLIADLVPSQITLGGVQRVLQNLLAERVSIRDLPTILEGISEACVYSRNATVITEQVRARLARQISNGHGNDGGLIPILTLSPEWEESFAAAIVGEGEERRLAMAPSRLQEFITAIRTSFERQAMLGETPVLLTSPAIRPYVRSVVERFRPATAVLSQYEIHPKARIKTVGQI